MADVSKIKVKGTKQFFKSKWLEGLTKTHPALIMGMYVPLCGYLVYYFHTYVNPSWWLLVAFFLLGVLTWTLTEYLMHRFVFHIAGESDRIKRFNYLVHGVHHEYPKDKQRLVMPPIPSMVLAGFFYLLFSLYTGDFVYVYFSGFIIAYLVYVSIHYATHAFAPPKNNMLNFLWKHHSLHHYKYPDRAFGVSSPMWDYVFGTMPPAKDQRISRQEAAKHL